MRLIIAGGRDVPPALADQLVGEALVASGWAPEVMEIHHGVATGIDAAAQRLR